MPAPLLRSLTTCLLALICVATTAHAARWPAIDPKELADAAPQIDPDAGSEILLHETTLKSYTGVAAWLHVFVRVKIYNERGVEANALIQIPYGRRTKFQDFAVRTIKADGTTLELAPRDIYDREVIKAGNIRQRMKSFAPAGLQPGVIVEYSYRIKRAGDVYPFIVEFQNDQPTRISRFKFYLEDKRGYGMSPQPLNCAGLITSRDSDFDVYTLKKISASKAEPFQPPVINREPALIFLSRYNHLRWWYETNTTLLKEFERKTQSSPLITSTLALFISATDTDEQKLRKIYDYCRTRFLNHDLETTLLTDAQWAHKNKDATDTLKAGHGTSEDINDTFAALVRAAGFRVTTALCNDRDFYFLGFDQDSNRLPRAPYVFTDKVVAVFDKEKTYRLFDPGSTYLPFEELSWKNSETAVYVSQLPKPDVVFFAAPPAKTSARKRHATLELAEDGTLQGDVELHYTGLWQTGAKHELDDATEEQRTLFVKNEIVPALKDAELTDIKVLNADRPELPLTITCRLHIAGYADRTASRLFLQPVVFAKNAGPLFPDQTRTHHILFRYPSTEHDALTITLPTGYEIESGSSPGAKAFNNYGSYETTVGINPRTRKMIINRLFVRHAITVPVARYPDLKAMYDDVHRRDAHVLTLKHATP